MRWPSAQHDRYWRVLARALLDGEDPRDMQKDFPVVRRIVEETRAAQERGKLASDVDVRLLTAMGNWLGVTLPCGSPPYRERLHAVGTLHIDIQDMRG